MHEEIKNSLKSGKACRRSEQNVVILQLLFKYIKVKIYETIILLQFLLFIQTKCT